MKIDRLVGIIMCLLQNEKVTAPYLAEKFEVTRRTIERDIVDICKAGIPLITEQGYGGGISISKNYKIDKTLFNKEELQAIITGLRAMDSVSEKSREASILEKMIKRKDRDTETCDYIHIDLAAYYKSHLSEKIKYIKAAIEDSRLLTFLYYYSKGSRVRLVEPYKIIYQWSSWYLLGYCTERNDFRLFKLNRMWNVEISEKTFMIREIPPEKLQYGSNLTDDIKLVARYDKRVLYRLIEEYGPNCYTETEEGILAEIGFTYHDSLMQWVLSFGEDIEVLQPESIRQDVICMAEKILQKYK